MDTGLHITGLLVLLPCTVRLGERSQDSLRWRSCAFNCALFSTLYGAAGSCFCSGLNSARLRKKVVPFGTQR